jgi:hypothetical protein
MGVALSATGSLLMASHAVGGMTATLTRREFRDLSVAAGRAALARLEAKAGSDPKGIFAEMGEVLMWLYALGNNGRKRHHMDPGLRWARTMHNHGWLLTELAYYDGGAMPGSFVLGRTTLGSLPHHRWLPTASIGKSANAEPLTYLAREYDAHIAGRSVIGTLRDELNRLAALTGSRA